MERRARGRRRNESGAGWLERAGWNSLAVALIGVLLVALMVWVESF